MQAVLHRQPAITAVKALTAVVTALTESENARLVVPFLSIPGKLHRTSILWLIFLFLEHLVAARSPLLLPERSRR